MVMFMLKQHTVPDYCAESPISHWPAKLPNTFSDCSVPQEAAQVSLRWELGAALGHN